MNELGCIKLKKKEKEVKKKFLYKKFIPSNDIKVRMRFSCFDEHPEYSKSIMLVQGLSRVLILMHSAVQFSTLQYSTVRCSIK